jgi:hypothetical protein
MTQPITETVEKYCVSVVSTLTRSMAEGKFRAGAHIRVQANKKLNKQAYVVHLIYLP